MSYLTEMKEKNGCLELFRKYFKWQCLHLLTDYLTQEKKTTDKVDFSNSDK